MVMRFYGWKPLIVNHHSAKFGGHTRCGSGDMIFLLVLVEGQDFTRPCLNPLLLFVFKVNDMSYSHTRILRNFFFYLQTMYVDR